MGEHKVSALTHIYTFFYYPLSEKGLSTSGLTHNVFYYLYKQVWTNMVDDSFYSDEEKHE